MPIPNLKKHIMKTTPITLLAGFALIAAAQAGTPSPAPAPAPGAGLWQWFAGASVGYLTDLEETMCSLQAGAEYTPSGARGSHSIYLEVAFTQDDASYSYNPPAGMTGGKSEKAAIDLNIIPITLNYKFEAPITEQLHYYLGVGLGIAILDSSYDWSWSQSVAPPGNQGGGSDDQTEARFYGDVFAGLAYEVCPSFEVFAGVRYIFMDDAERHMDVSGAADFTAGINHDVLLELGARYNF